MKYTIYHLILLVMVAAPLSAHPISPSLQKSLCGNYIPHKASQKALDVQRLPSPDRKCNVVMGHGEGDASYFWIEEVATKKAFGKDPPANYDLTGICWDPQKPVVYYSLAPIYGDAGVYKWAFREKGSKPVRLEEQSTLKTLATREPYYELKDIDLNGNRLLLLLLYKDVNASEEPINKYYVLNISTGALQECAGCSLGNWQDKTR